MSDKRKDYISWDEYFMGVALLSGERSKDPNSQVGACIVSEDNKILSIGYNGFPRNCDDDKFNWERNPVDDLGPKYDYVVHAELNAILNSGSNDLNGSTLYTKLFPCNECAKAIIQSGISRVVYLSMPESKDHLKFKQSQQMFIAAGVKFEQFNINPNSDQDILNLFNVDWTIVDKLSK